MLSELGRVRGTLPIRRAAGAIIVGERAADWLGPVGFVGDLDQDGFDELVTATRQIGSGSRVYVFRGPVSGTHSAADADLVIEADVGANFDAVRGGRDLDGDRVPDLVLGATGSRPGGLVSAGSVFVVSGADVAAAMR